MGAEKDGKHLFGNLGIASSDFAFGLHITSPRVDVSALFFIFLLK